MWRPHFEMILNIDPTNWAVFVQFPSQIHFDSSVFSFGFFSRHYYLLPALITCTIEPQIIPFDLFRLDFMRVFERFMNSH